MQQFTLIHDGSDQAWQAAYLAFHFASRLGAPLLALIVNSSGDNQIPAQNAAQIEISGRAACVEIETHILKEYSMEYVAALSMDSDGIFIPRRLIASNRAAKRYLEALPCPLWIVSKGSEVHEMALLVNDYQADERLIQNTITLARRTELPLTGIIKTEEMIQTSENQAFITWISLPDLSLEKITWVLKQQDINLLFVPVSALSIAVALSINCVIYLVPENA